ncbi:MAG: hypothetical protein AMXMBFR33_63790 [Candidatus Xenobia bacterium]
MLILARLYVLEALRRREHLVTLFLACVLLMMPAYVNSFSLGPTEMERVALDFGLTLIGYALAMMAIYIGSQAVSGDIDRGTLYPILARPMERGVYLAGKVLGILLVLCGSALILGFCLMTSVAALTRFLDPLILLVALYYGLESTVLATCCLMFSTFTTPSVAGIFGVICFFVGGLSQDFLSYFSSQPWSKPAAIMKSLIPNLELLRVKNLVVHSRPVSWSYLASSALYGLAWISLLWFGAARIFSRRDL